MIWPTEALMLAGTKLKTRRIRLIVTVFITSLLFAVLVFLGSLTEGVVQSIKSFNQEGYGNKFLVQALPATYLQDGRPDQELVAQLQPVQRDLVARKKASAKKLNIQYDEQSDQMLPLHTANYGPGQTETFPNHSNPLVAELLEKKNLAIPGTSFEEFTKTAEKAGATATYRGTAATMFGVGGMTEGQVQVMVDGKEDFKTDDKGMYGGPMGGSGVATIASGWRSADLELLRPFVLPAQSMVTGKDGSVPVVAPFSAAEEILGLKALPATASAQQKLERLKLVREQVAGKTAQLCYRNNASGELVQEAARQLKEIEANKGKKDYVMPALLYRLPTEPCGAVTIKSDKRSAEEKKEAANKEAFDKEFGHFQEPEQGIITIRIIGLNPDINNGPSMVVSSILMTIFGSSAGTGWISPAPAVEQNKLASIVQGGTAKTAARSKVAYYAEFPTLAAMEKFIKDQECQGSEWQRGPDGNLLYSGMIDPESMIADCIRQGKVLTVAPYGNSAGAVEQFREGVWSFARYVILVIVVIAALIMMGNVGKIIADSRRETAVFRSLGAKRLDIAQIYLTYTLLIGLLIVVVSAILGSLAALWLSSRYSPEISVAAVLAYNAQDINKQFSLFGFNPLYVLAVAGLIILAGLLSASLPLLSNMRRNPIQDMRDES